MKYLLNKAPLPGIDLPAAPITSSTFDTLARWIPSRVRVLVVAPILFLRKNNTLKF
jgi:hypothetical protein